jgi:hypothetical protein
MCTYVLAVDKSYQAEQHMHLWFMMPLRRFKLCLQGGLQSSLSTQPVCMPGV